MSSRKWGHAISARGGFVFNSRKFITARIYREREGEWTRDSYSLPLRYDGEL